MGKTIGIMELLEKVESGTVRYKAHDYDYESTGKKGRIYRAYMMCSGIPMDYFEYVQDHLED